MKEFTGSIQYSAQNVRRLSSVLYRCFSRKQRRNILLLSAALMMGGAVAGAESTAAVLCIVLGCIILSNVNYPANSVAKKTIKALNGAEPLMNYTFYPNYFSGDSGKEKARVEYKKLVKIVDDGKFLYLCPNSSSAFMVDKQSVEPKDVTALKELVSGSCSLCWDRPRQVSLGKLRDAFKRRKT